MKFKKPSKSKVITAEDYQGKPCTLRPYDRLKAWRIKNRKLKEQSNE